MSKEIVYDQEYFEEKDNVDDKAIDEYIHEIKELNEIIDEIEENILKNDKEIRAIEDDYQAKCDEVITLENELREVTDAYDDMATNADTMFEFISQNFDADALREFHKTLTNNYILNQMNRGKKVYY